MSQTEVLEVAVLLVAALIFGIVIGRLTKPDDPPVFKPAEPEPVPLPAAPPATRISIEALVDPALIVAGETVLAANQAARQLLGERVIGRDLGMTVRHPALLDALATAREGMGVDREIGGIGPANTAWRLRVEPDGEGRALILFDDVTQARATERMRVDFVANASHELRTPLATLAGFIETLQGPAAEDEPARQRFLGIMATEADRMSRLIDDLLSLSRIELDKYVRPADRLDLAGMIADVGRTLQVRLDADQRTLVIDEAADLPDVIADRDQVLQLLHNLISNALKYGHSGTPITVSARPDPDGAHVRISVADVGEGIASEHLPRLTERFYRVDSQRSRTMGGTGLGLAIVKHIVERHRGRLEIESRQGQGTKVSFTLPVAPPLGSEPRHGNATEAS
jgi:two-component system phosphate regulon sensor histidine kinase PhoR